MASAANPDDQGVHLDQVNVTSVVRGWCAETGEQWLDYQQSALADAPDAIHQMRVTSRRLRAVLRRWQPVLSTPVQDLSQELRWVAHALGDVRDLEVLRDQLTRELPPAAADWVEEQLTVERDQARQILSEDFALPRFARVCEAVRRLDTVQIRPEWSHRPARRLLPLVRAQGLSARAAWDAACLDLRETPTAEQWELAHKARRAAKAARYLAEAVDQQAPDHGVRTWGTAYKRVADTLGEVQDGVITAATARRLAERAPDEHVRTALLAAADHEIDQQDNRLEDAFIAIQSTRAHQIG